MSTTLADGLRSAAVNAFRDGAYNEARENFAALVEITNHTWDRLWLGLTLHLLGHYAEACDAYELVLLGDSAEPFALHHLAHIKASCADASLRDGKKAADLANHLCEISNWKNWAHVSVLAAAHAENGDWEQAERFAALALELAPEDEKVRRQTRLDQYRARRPFRSSAESDRLLLVPNQPQ